MTWAQEIHSKGWKVIAVSERTWILEVEEQSGVLRAGLTGHNYGSFSVIKPCSVSSRTKGRALINNESPPSIPLIHTNMVRPACTDTHSRISMHMYEKLVSYP